MSRTGSRMGPSEIVFSPSFVSIVRPVFMANAQNRSGVIFGST